MTDISGLGLAVRILASNTFPVGFEVNQFTSDTDPLDIAALQIADAEMGLNGDLITWSNANPIPLTLSVIPGSDNDKALSILFEANRAGAGKRSAQDQITAVVTYPDGGFVTLTKGYCREFTPGRSVAGSGRIKTKNYVFGFENKVEAP